MDRRDFLKKSILGVIGISLNKNTFAENEKKKIVYFYRDVHQGNKGYFENQNWDQDLKIINAFCENNNIRTICIEGWAGVKVDKERKKLLLNGEEDLILALLNTKRYNLVGLEKKNAQEELIRNLTFFNCINYQIVSKMITFPDTPELASAKKGFIWLEKYNIKRLKLLGENHKPPFLKYIKKMMRRKSFVFDGYYQILKGDASRSFREFQKSTLFRFSLEIFKDTNEYCATIHEFRDKFACDQIIQRNEDKIVVVFGKNHYESMKKKLNEEGWEVIPIN